MRRLAFIVLVAACTMSAPTPSPSLVPGGIGGVVPSAWVFAGALALPPDPNVYGNVILDAQPLSDGGWIVLRAPAQRRPLCDPTWYGCFVPRMPGILERLDPSGRVVIREHGAEPFGLVHVHVFEQQGVVVGEGVNNVRNGNVHAFRLDTLDGISTEMGACVQAEGHCYSYKPDFQSGASRLDERDPRDLRVTRSVAPALGGLYAPPAVYPALNLVAWRPQNDPSHVRATALDASRLVTVPWLARLESACDISRVGDDRALVIFGPAACHGDAGWHAELIEVSTGRTVRAFATGQTISGNARDAIVLADSGIVVDPRNGGDGPTLAGGDPLSVDWDRGVAIAPLSDGGAAIYRRAPVAPAGHDVTFSTLASAGCVEYEFPIVMKAISSNVRCAALVSEVGPDRLLVATGRLASGPTAFTVTRVAADATTRVIDVRYAGTGRRTTITDPSPSAVIELHDVPSGEWLVRFSDERADSYGARAYVVRFP